ncbi:MAG TPA: ABC transporter permease subunit [Candidatus Dormibacteraeota bacterium]|nr:ABC transporter permease subunit [Candidatus Dormibacteraeota bacterium]
MSSAGIVFRKEMREILRDRRTLIAIALAALATPIVLFVISQVSVRTATQVYTVGYSGDIPAGLEVLFGATGLRLEPVSDPASAAKQQVDLGVVFTANSADEYYDPTRQNAQLADVRFQTVLSKYDAAKVAASLQERGLDPSVLNPLPVSVHPLSSPTQAAQNSFLSFFLPYILITMSLTGGLSAALDTSAGERERKTLESLLMTPAPRAEVLVGKILAVTLTSLAAALVAITSMLIALSQITFGGGAGIANVTLSPLAAVVMFWLAVLLAAAFAAVTIALGTLARNFRQGQAYATPLYFITIFPAAIVLFIPDFNPNLAYYLIPILNAVLVLRDAIVHGTVDWLPLAVTSLSLLVTGAACFYAALRLFTREALLVRS